MEPRELLKHCEKWTKENKTAFLILEYLSISDYNKNALPRIKHNAEVVRGKGYKIDNSALTFCARYIEHRNKIPMVKSRSKIDVFITDRYWEKFDDEWFDDM